MIRIAITLCYIALHYTALLQYTLPYTALHYHTSIRTNIRTYINTLHTYLHTCTTTYLHTYLPKPTNLPTYLPTNIHTYIPTYIPTYLHTYLRTYIPTYLHTYIPTYLHTYIPTYLHYITLHYITLRYVTLQYSTSHHITSHDIKWHDITIQCSTIQHNIIHTYVHTYITFLCIHIQFISSCLVRLRTSEWLSAFWPNSNLGGWWTLELLQSLQPLKGCHWLCQSREHCNSAKMLVQAQGHLANLLKCQGACLVLEYEQDLEIPNTRGILWATSGGVIWLTHKCLPITSQSSSISSNFASVES